MESFAVENFRSLKHLNLEKLARVNLLVGKNNSGKTSVLEGVFAIAGIHHQYWVQSIESNRNLNSDKSNFQHLFHNFDTNNSVKLSNSYCGEQAEAKVPVATLSATLQIQNRPGLSSRELSLYDQQPNAPKNPHTPDSLFVTVETSELGKPINFELRRSFKQEYTDMYFTDQHSKEYMEQGPAFIAAPRNLVRLITTATNAYWLNDELATLKINKQEGAILKILRTIDNRIERIELLPNNQIYIDLGLANLLPLNLMGDGIQRLLAILTAMVSSASGMLLVDEIDNGLHYSALRILWKGILQAAREYNVQILATTHSAEALHHLTWVLDDEEYKDYRDDVAAYTLIRAKDDTVRSYRYDYEQLDFALEHDVEVRN